MISAMKNWLWKLKFHEFKVLDAMSIHKKTSSFLAHHFFIDKTKPILIPQVRISITNLTLNYKCCVMESETISVNLPGVHCFPYTAKQFCLSAPFTSSSISIHSVKYLKYSGDPQ